MYEAMDFKLYTLSLCLMVLSLLTLNTGGCSSPVKNASIFAYADNICNKPDIILLQETYNLTDDNHCWNTWYNYTPLCNPSPSRGSGVTVLLKNNINLIESSIIHNGHVSYVKINFNNILYSIYDVLIPQSNRESLKAIQHFTEHSDSLSDSTIIVGGDPNSTDNPLFDRLNMSTEHRPKTAMALRKAFVSLFIV